MPRSDKNIEWIVRITDNCENLIVYASNLAFLSNDEIEGYEKKRILLFQGHSDEVLCNKCIKGSCTVPVKRVDYPDGRKMGMSMCPDPEQGGPLDFTLEEMRYWLINKDRLVELGYCKTGYEVMWNESNELYIPLKDIVKIAGSESLPMQKLSKMLQEPEFPVRRMHSGRRCRVHITDFRKWLEHTQLSTSEKATEKSIKGIEQRKKEERDKKKKR